MILFRSLKGWGLKGLVKMLFYEIQFVLKDGFSTFKNIGHKSKNHSNIDNYNIPTPAVYIKEIEKVFQNFHEFTFIDVGSGRGRVLRAAVNLNFNEIISIEKSRKLNKKLKQMFGREIFLHEGDAKDFLLKKSSNAIFYFFESFSEDIFIDFIKRQIQNNKFNSMFVVLVYSRKENNLNEYLEDFHLFHSLIFSERRKLIILKKK